MSSLAATQLDKGKSMSETSIHWRNDPATELLNSAELANDWDRLNALRGDLPFLASDVIATALSIFGSGRERLLVGKVNARTCAMFLLVPQGRVRWSTFQPSQIPLGAWVATQDFTLQALAKSLIRGPLGLCIVLSITQVDPRVAPRAPDALDSEHVDYIETGWVEIADDFDTYWNARGKNLRANMRKQRNKLAASGVALGMETLDQHGEIASAIEQYGMLESAGWKAGQGTAVSLDNEQGRFYRAVLELASLRGEARVYQYKFDEKVVAMNLCLVRRDTLVILKTTFDESFKTLSPAFLLSEDQLKSLFKEGQIQRLEYFGRMMEWHTRWTDKQRTIYHLTQFRIGILKQLAQYRRKRLHARDEAAANKPSADVTTE